MREKNGIAREELSYLLPQGAGRERKGPADDRKERSSSLLEERKRNSFLSRELMATFTLLREKGGLFIRA